MTRIRRPMTERFWSKVDRTGDACWEWKATHNQGGYGQMWIETRLVVAHRISWELANGPIPDGLVVCHSCDNPPCVRPSHLFLGDMKANSQDMVQKGRHPNSRKTHCKAGHELSGGNLIDRGRGHRGCRSCSIASKRRYNARKRVEVRER